MNERIDELAFQSGITQHSYSNPKHPDLDGFIVSQEKLDKFAELIIKKCVMIGNYAHDGGEYPGPMIKEYFGVK
jgi:hypothetical protein